jgi:hypothetical protein
VADDDLKRETDRLIAQVGHWEAPRWAIGGRADRVHDLVQRLADRAADAEGEPRRPVPRLADPALPDQLRVVVADLRAAAQPHLLAEAAEDIAKTRRAL